MNLKKNYASVSGATDLKSTLLDKSKGIRNFNMYMKKGAFDKTNISKNIKSFSINEKINYNKILTENTNKYKPLETRNEISKNSPSDTSFSNNKIDIKISVNYLKNNSNLKELGKKIIYLVKTEDNNKGSLSNILMQDLQSKENMLKNMKSSMSEDKIRKKIFSNEKDLNITNIAKNEVKPIHKRNPTSNQDIIQNNLNISLLTYENRPRIQNIYNNTTTNKMHLTTNNTVISNNPSISGNFMNTQQNMNNSNVLLGNSYTLNNIYNRDKINDSSFLHQTHQDQTVNSSSNLFKDTSITYANSSNNILKDNNKIITLDKEYLLKIANLEKKFDEIHIFSSSTSNNNITIIAQKYRVSLSYKFKAYKKIFDEYNNVSTSNESSGLTTKIANGYNDIVKNILNQYSSVLEKLTINNNDNKKLNEANSEILRLRTKLNEVELKKTKPKQSNLAIENNIKFNIKSSANLAVKNNPINKINNDINSIKLSSNIVENNNYINIPDNKNNNTNIPNNVTNSNSVINKSFILPIENSEHNKIISGNKYYINNSL